MDTYVVHDIAFRGGFVLAVEGWCSRVKYARARGFALVLQLAASYVTPVLG